MNLGIHERTTRLINEDCLKMIKGEVVGIIFLIICEYILIGALLRSDKNKVLINGLELSLYYVFPVVVVGVAIIYLLFRFLKIYKNVVFSYDFRNGLVLNILGVFNRKLVIYSVHDKEYLIGYFEGFKRKYYRCIGIEANKNIYLIPFKNENKADLLKELDRAKSGG